MPRRKQQTPKRLKTGKESDDDQDDDHISSDEEKLETDSTRASTPQTPPIVESPLRSLSLMVGETSSANFKKELFKDKEQVVPTQDIPLDFTVKSRRDDEASGKGGKLPDPEQVVALDLSLKRTHSESGFSDKMNSDFMFRCRSPSSKSPQNRSPVEHMLVQRNHDSSLKSKERCSPSIDTNHDKDSKKTVHHNLIPKEALVNISKMPSDYNALPPQVNFYRTSSDQGNFVLCTDCYQAFPNIGMLSIHLIATGHKSMKSVNTQLLQERGYNVMMAPKGNLFSTCSLRRRPKPPGGFRTRDVCTYRCAVCGRSFCDFFEYTVHLSKTKHDMKQQLSNKGFEARPKLETGAFQEEIPVAQVMKCIVCRESFPNLEDLTMHMLRTQHYNKVPGHKSGYSHRTEDVTAAVRRDMDDDEDDLMDTGDSPTGLMIPDKVCVISRDSPNFQVISQVPNMSENNEILACQPLKAQKPLHSSESNANRQRSPSDSDAEDRCQSDDQFCSEKYLMDGLSWRKGRPLRCTRCTHTFTNIQRLSAHMKQSGHYLNHIPDQKPSWKTMQQRLTGNGTFTHLKLMSTQQQVANKLSVNCTNRPGQEDTQYNGEKVKCSPDVDEGCQEDTDNKHDRLEPTIRSSNNHQEVKNQSKSMPLPDYLPKENSIQQLYSFVHNEVPPSMSSQAQVHAPVKKYVDPDDFVVILPTGSKVNTDKMSENPLGNLACMVQTAKEMNFEKRAFSSNVDRWVTRAVDDIEDEVRTIPSTLTGLPKWYSAQRMHFRRMNRSNSQETMSDKTDIESSHSEEKDTPSIKTESTDVDLESSNKMIDGSMYTANTLIEKLVNDSDDTDAEKADEIEQDKTIKHSIHPPHDSNCRYSPLSVLSRRATGSVENVQGKNDISSHESDYEDDSINKLSVKSEPVRIWPEPGSGVIVRRSIDVQKPSEPMETDAKDHAKQNCSDPLPQNLSSPVREELRKTESPLDKLVTSVSEIPMTREENGNYEIRTTTTSVKSKISIKEEQVSKTLTRKKHENTGPVQYIRPQDSNDPFCMSDPLSEIDKLVSNTTGVSGSKSLMPVKMGKFLKDIKPNVSAFRPSQQYFREMYTPSNIASDPLKEMDRMVNATT
ncbi:teashirt homolog 1-B-like [Anneissia japonica]|uniref:teashirt homolog 1-B-like n=1 Tax=Anneissia japonica TaxID=1529436 RepID=UPI0014257B24|nr:teashirt homolog 1-B-like [Anneissia japonica]